MKRYEGMFIIKPHMNQDELDRTVSSLEETIKKNGGKVEACQKWAARPLAYSIKKYAEGEYYLCDFLADPKSISSMEKSYRLNENILRFLITAKER